MVTKKMEMNLIYYGGCCHFYYLTNPVHDAINPSYIAIKDRNDTGNGQAEYVYVKLSCIHLKHSNMFDLPVDETINLTIP